MCVWKFRSCYFRTSRFWPCHIVLYATECILNCLLPIWVLVIIGTGIDFFSNCCRWSLCLQVTSDATETGGGVTLPRYSCMLTGSLASSSNQCRLWQCFWWSLMWLGMVTGQSLPPFHAGGAVPLGSSDAAGDVSGAALPQETCLLPGCWNWDGLGRGTGSASNPGPSKCSLESRHSTFPPVTECGDSASWGLRHS